MFDTTLTPAPTNVQRWVDSYVPSLEGAIFQIHQLVGGPRPWAEDPEIRAHRKASADGLMNPLSALLGERQGIPERGYQAVAWLLYHGLFSGAFSPWLVEEELRHLADQLSGRDEPDMNVAVNGNRRGLVSCLRELVAYKNEGTFISAPRVAPALVASVMHIGAAMGHARSEWCSDVAAFEGVVSLFAKLMLQEVVVHPDEANYPADQFVKSYEPTAWMPAPTSPHPALVAAA